VKTKNLMIGMVGLVLVGVLSTPVGAATQAVTLTDVTGVVEIISHGKTDGYAAAVGSSLSQGDTIRTYGGSKAEITFENAGVIYVNSSSRLTITKAQISGDATETITMVSQGKMRAKVRKLAAGSLFETHTPVAVAAVRGTEYRVFVDDTGATKILVISGSIRVTSGGVTVIVKAGESTTVDNKGSAPSMPEQDSGDSKAEDQVEDKKTEVNSRDIQIEEIEDKENPMSPA